MSLLTSDNLIDVKVYYQEIKRKSGGQKIKVLTKKEAEIVMENNKLEEKNFKDNPDNEGKEFELDSNKEVHILNTKWKQTSWAEQNAALKECLIKNDFTGEMEIDQLVFRDKKVKNCLKEWDLKDEAGNEVPVMPDIIDVLPFDIIISLVAQYDKNTRLDEEDEKK